MTVANKVSHILREFRQEMGGVIPFADLLRRGLNEGLTEEEIRQGLNKLAEDGLITERDNEAIEFA